MEEFKVMLWKCIIVSIKCDLQGCSLLTALRTVSWNKTHNDAAHPFSPTNTQICCYWTPVENMYCPCIFATTSSSVKRRPYSNCCQLCHSLRQTWCIDREVAEASTVQCNSVWDVCVTGGHILYMSACSVQSERRTHRDHLLFLFPDRTAAADNPIRCGCRSERPGEWRTICSLAVPRMVRLNWSPCGGSPPVVFSLHSLSSPPPDPLGSEHHCQNGKTQTAHFRLRFSN